MTGAGRRRSEGVWRMGARKQDKAEVTSAPKTRSVMLKGGLGTFNMNQTRILRKK